MFSYELVSPLQRLYTYIIPVVFVGWDLGKRVSMTNDMFSVYCHDVLVTVHHILCFFMEDLFGSRGGVSVYIYLKRTKQMLYCARSGGLRK